MLNSLKSENFSSLESAYSNFVFVLIIKDGITLFSRLYSWSCKKEDLNLMGALITAISHFSNTFFGILPTDIGFGCRRLYLFRSNGFQYAILRSAPVNADLSNAFRESKSILEKVALAFELFLETTGIHPPKVRNISQTAFDLFTPIIDSFIITFPVSTQEKISISDKNGS